MEKIIAGNMSRRDFLHSSALTGAGIATAATVTSMTSMKASAEEASAAEREIFNIETPSMQEGTWSWSTPPANIPDDDIAQTIECDVLVIGAGLAGCCAALSAMDDGATTIVIDKIEEGGVIPARGLDIGVFGTKVQQKLIDEGLIEEPDYAHIVRRWTMWAQSRVRESLLWKYARKSGAAFDWLYDKVTPRGLEAYVWNGYYKGPDYTEYPVAHIFAKADHLQEASEYPLHGGYGEIFACGILLPELYDLISEGNGEIRWSQQCVRLIRESNGPCTGAIAQGADGSYTKYLAKSVVIASGDYASNPEMVQCYAPSVNFASDAVYYIPPDINQGEIHQQAMWIGAAMQASMPHAAVVHLDFGASSYGFLHVNAAGKRYMNEDVNTQSKSITKALQPGKTAHTIYDANSLAAVKEQLDTGVGGGLQWGLLAQAVGRETSFEALEQQLQNELDQGLVVSANSLDELAELIKVDPATFKATVDRYNKMCEQGHDDDFGKRPEILTPITTPPFYAGKLMAGCLTMCGGLRSNDACEVLDAEDNAIGGLYVCGSAQGDFFGPGDYPTLVPGVGLGRCVTFGRIAGINAAGGDADAEIPDLESLKVQTPETDVPEENIYIEGGSATVGQDLKGL